MDNLINIGLYGDGSRIARLCTDYAAAYAEISAIMGVFMVDDEPSRNSGKLEEKLSGTIDTTNGSIACAATDHFCEATGEEDNMDKPRICKVLSVEVEERFKIDGYGAATFYINENGEVCSDNTNNPDYCAAIYQAINHPERIIRKPRFTEQEVTDAKTLCRMWPNGEIKFKRDTDGRCAMVHIQGCLHGCLDLGEVNLFPSIKPGESYILNKIVGANNADNI